jgi:hypothetical protein
MNNELERMYEEAVVPFFWYCVGICLEVLRNGRRTSHRIADLRAQISTRDLPNTKLEC